MDLARTRREREREREKFFGGGGVISKVLDWKQLRTADREKERERERARSKISP